MRNYLAKRYICLGCNCGRVQILLILFIIVISSCQAAPSGYSGVFDSSAGRWVDLTHSFAESTIYWPTDTAGFQLQELAFGQTEGGWFYASYQLASAEHGGTHLDAPIHFSDGGLTNDQIPLSGLIGPAAIVDVSGKVDPDYLVSVEDLATWETVNGEIQDGAILLIHTGWSDRWDDRRAYLGTDVIGEEAVAQLHFPGISEELAQWLVDERGIVALGIDTPSIDYGQSSDFRAHVILYRENISGFENITNLDFLPATGSFVVALPMKIEGGSGGPLRIVAFVPAELGS